MTSRDRRALIAGGAVILAALLGLRVVPWAVAGAVTARRDLEERAALLARVRAELGALPQLRDSAAALTQALVALAPRVLDGSNAIEAGADLAARVTHAAVRAPARLDRVEPVPDTATAGRLARASVRAALETDVRGLVRSLQMLDGDAVVLTVRRLDVASVDPATPERRPEILRVEIIVSGWFLRGRESGRQMGGG